MIHATHLSAGVAVEGEGLVGAAAHTIMQQVAHNHYPCATRNSMCDMTRWHVATW